MTAPDSPDSPDSQLSIMTFNLLAPPYKRLSARGAPDARERERDHEALWTARLDAILASLRAISPPPTVLALQEVWFHKPFLAKLEAAFAPQYHIFYARRPHKEDGLATLVAKRAAALRDVTHVSTFLLSDGSFKGACDRIALAVSAELLPPSPPSPQQQQQQQQQPQQQQQHDESTPARSRLLLVNTHLTFPHSFIAPKMRDMQANVLTTFVNGFCKGCVQPVATVLLGDFNSDLESSVCRSVQAQGFSSCYQQLHGSEHAPVTHLNHRRQHVFVDHVFVRHGRGKERTSPSPVSVVRHVAAATATAALSATAIVPVLCSVLPEHVPTLHFPPDFKLSDHRPVRVAFERVVVPVWR